MPAAAPRGGGGADAAADFSTLLARLDVIERRLQGGSGKGGKGDGRRDHSKGGPTAGAAFRAGAAKGGGGARGKPGDWQCQACQAYPCFARTTACYVCGAARGGKGAGAGIGGGAGGAQAYAKGSGAISRQRKPDEYLGPVGAGGTRPLLGRRGTDVGQTATTHRDRADCPTARVLGASLAARSEAAAADQGGQTAGGGPSMRVDEEGYQMVRNGTSKRAAERAAEEVNAGGRRMPKRAHGAWAELSEQPEEDDDPSTPQQGDDAMGEDEHDNGDGGAAGPAGDHGDDEARQPEEKVEGDGGGEAQEQQLRREWQSYCQVCKNLERDATTPARLLADARAQRDEAEKKWRAAKAPHPLYKRMRWAEAELRDAQAKESLHQRELDAHLEQSARRTRELEARQRTDAARTARKLAALQELHREGANAAAPPVAERAARVAATGMGQDVIPALVAAVERLAMPLGDDAEAFRDELRLVASAASRVERVLKEAVTQAPAGCIPARFDIGDAGSGGSSSDGAAATGGDCDGGKATGRQAATTPEGATSRWQRTQEHGPWRRASSSEAAAQQARSLIAQHVAAQEAPAPGTAHERSSSAAGNSDAATGTAIPEQQQAASGATTNDLAEAERRERRLAEAQFQREVLQGHRTVQQLQQEELQRQQRMQQQQEELRRHQEQLQRANEARAAEEAKQRDALIASMSQDELARAAALHAQQAAVGSRAFGTQAASELAGLAHQHHVHSVASAAGAADEGAAVDALMAMSPEEFATWERDRHGFAADGAGW